MNFTSPVFPTITSAATTPPPKKNYPYLLKETSPLCINKHIYVSDPCFIKTELLLVHTIFFFLADHLLITLNDIIPP